LPLTRKSKIIVGVAGAVFALDRLTKLLILAKLGLYQVVTVIDGWFDIVHVRNKGAAFSMLSTMDESYRTAFFMVVSLLAIGFMGWFVVKAREDEKLTVIALAMIIGGAAGNLTDRVLYGDVVDFIDWHVGTLHWPVFNIADSGITVGIALLAIDAFFKGKAGELR